MKTKKLFRSLVFFAFLLTYLNSSSATTGESSSQEEKKEVRESLPKKEAKQKKAPAPKQEPKKEFSFEKDIVELGKSSLSLLKEKKFESFDPLMGDWSCQLRTLWMINLIRNHPDFDPLSEEQLSILGMYRLLTVSTTDEVDPFGMLITQFTNTKFKPVGWESISNSKMLEFYGTAKKQLSDRVIRDLNHQVEESSIAYKNSILDRFKDQTFTRFSGIPLRFLEFFTGYVVVTNLALEKNIPVIIALKQFSNDHGSYSVNGVKTLFYKPVHGKFVYSEEIQDLDSPAIVIQMYSGVSTEHHSVKGDQENEGIYSFTLQKNFEKVWTGFVKLDLIDVILAIAATHAQFPTQAFISKENGHPLAISQLSDEVLHKDEIFDLYKHYREMGLKEKIGTQLYLTENGIFTENIPINTEHVYVSTFRRVEEEQNSFFKKVKDQSLKLNELLNLNK